MYNTIYRPKCRPVKCIDAKEDRDRVDYSIDFGCPWDSGSREFSEKFLRNMNLQGNLWSFVE
jgi:hypothetical protein